MTRKKLVIALSGALAGLLLATLVTDRAMAARAQDRLADRLQSAANLPSRPQVEIGGLGAGLEAASGSVGSVTVTAHDVVRGPKTGVHLSTVTAHLSGVSGGKGQGMSAEHAEIQAVVGWDDLSARFARGKQAKAMDGATLTSGGDGLVAVHRTASVLGQQLPVTIYLKPALDGDRLTFTPTEVEVLGTRRSGTKLLQRLGQFNGGAGNLSRALPKPPGGLSYASVTATDAGLQLTLTGDDVHLDREGLAR